LKKLMDTYDGLSGTLFIGSSSRELLRVGSRFQLIFRAIFQVNSIRPGPSTDRYEYNPR